MYYHKQITSQMVKVLHVNKWKKLKHYTEETFCFHVSQKSSVYPTDFGDADLYTIDVVWSEIQFAVSLSF